MDATTAQTLIDKYLAAYQQWVSTRGNNEDGLKNWGAILADPSINGYAIEYTAALDVGCVARHAAYDPTQLATDISDWQAIAAAQGITGTLT